MKKRQKRLIILGIILLLSVVVFSVGRKYFPFAKMIKMPAGSEKEYVNSQKTAQLPPHTLYYDFEVAPGKEMPGGFYKGQAHSGQYSVKAFGQNSFSLVVERTAGEVGVENLKAVALSAWVYVFPTKTDVKGSFVFTASNEVGVNVCWHGVYVREPEVPRGKWFKVSSYFDLSSIQFKPGYKLQFYFWNTSSTDILVDDYFVSFGNAVDRRGDSARVDMTKPGGYVPKFNYPPFPVSLLEKLPLNRSVNPADIAEDDLTITGNFFKTGSDGIIAIRKEGRPSAWIYCPELREFRKVSLTNPAVLTSLAPVKKVMKGKFLTAPGEQFLVTGAKGWLLCSITPPENLCKNDGTLQATINILWKSTDADCRICAGDFTADHRTALLETSGKGSWRVMSFEIKGKDQYEWKVQAEANDPPVAAWSSGQPETNISAGSFMPGFAGDVVLTVTGGGMDKQAKYYLHRFDPAGKRWEPVYRKEQDHAGKIIGLDTLKPADIFYSVSSDGSRKTVYRYNRDWRYDLKEIRFNDSIFSILSGVDFHGYTGDQNPKYYEALKLVPGYFLNSSTASFLVIGHVKKSRNYQSVLPDFIDLYSIPATK